MGEVIFVIVLLLIAGREEQQYTPPQPPPEPTHFQHYDQGVEDRLDQLLAPLDTLSGGSAGLKS